MITNAKTWTAFILSGNPLFGRGLERLLQQEYGVEVVGSSEKSDDALAQIRLLKPDVIIVDAGRKMREPYLILSRLLGERPEVRVVRVSLEDNSAAVYTGRTWTANGVEDLIRGILEPMVLSLREK